MSLVVGGDWDDNLDLCLPVDHSPVGSLGEVDTVIKKFGAGSLTDKAGNLSLDYDFNDSVLPRDIGAIAFWYYFPVDEDYLVFELDHSEGHQADNFLYIIVNCDVSGNGGYVELHMKNSDGLAVFNTNTDTDPYPIAVATWHHFELNWKWNSPSGFTKLFIDGVEDFNRTDGNVETRAGGNITNSISIDAGSTGNMDDLAIFDQIWHSGGFTPPGVALACGVVTETGANTYGWPYGMNPGNIHYTR
jgi:hypothetical protein